MEVEAQVGQQASGCGMVEVFHNGKYLWGAENWW